MLSPLLELGGAPSAPLLHLAVANGFVPQTYFPLLHNLLPHYRAVCLPPRALWGDVPCETSTDWKPLADDLLAGMAHYALPPLIAVGHSLGGVVSMLAALREPARFRALILLDPTILPQAILEMVKLAHAQNIVIPQAQGALRRRREFASVEEAFANFRSKAIFAQWDETALRYYAEYGTTPLPDGTRTLTWSPEWEAHYFTTVHTETWADAPRLNDLSLPILFLRGGESDTYTPETAAQIAELVPRATHMSLAGHGHLFPQSAPHETAQVIFNWLQAQGLD